MACHHPLPAWRTGSGEIKFGTRLDPYATELRLPCGGCLGCRMASTREWALRCRLELQQHQRAAFLTLTYDEEHVPPTLSKRELQLALKRLRKKMGTARPLRFFASGEYGEQTARPHYHVLAYGLDASESDLIDSAWKNGFVDKQPVTLARIHYVAGYTAKKIGDRRREYTGGWTNPETGEWRPDKPRVARGWVPDWQPPFIVMSRRPGIGANAKEFTESWKQYAVMDGNRMPVPRYLHAAWRETATEEEITQLQELKRKIALTRDTTPERLTAKEVIAIARQAQKGSKRKYG